MDYTVSALGDLVTLPLTCEMLEDSALDSEMLQMILDTPEKLSEQYEILINWEMHISYAEMEHREKLVQGAET